MSLSVPFAPLFVVAAAMADAQGRFLVQQRPPGGSMAGLWEFPGGKVEPDEAPVDALIRELAEELGVGITPDAVTPMTFATGKVGPATLVLLLYRVAHWRGEATPLHASALRWERPDALAHLPMPPADAPLVAALIAGA